MPKTTMEDEELPRPFMAPAFNHNKLYSRREFIYGKTKSETKTRSES